MMKTDSHNYTFAFPRLFVLLLLLLIGNRPAPKAVSPTAPLSSPPTIFLETVATGLASPVDITHAGDGSGRLFIVLQSGQIVIYDGVQVLGTPFLDISLLVFCCGEQGLLGLTFHPNYASNRYFYVNYTDTNGNTVIARYSASGGDP